VVHAQIEHEYLRLFARRYLECAFFLNARPVPRFQRNTVDRHRALDDLQITAPSGLQRKRDRLAVHDPGIEPCILMNRYGTVPSVG
jgi:hypothetical protein